MGVHGKNIISALFHTNDPVGKFLAFNGASKDNARKKLSEELTKIVKAIPFLYMLKYWRYNE